jgi:hypothetical protein
MNGRMYDPVLGRFLSADPYVPNPEYSQDYNRYSYARNNPMIYTDPDGEFVIGYTFGFFRGLFTSDPNKDFWGRTWEVTSRFTWQLPQTIIGLGFSNISNLAGQVDKVEYKYGTTVLNGNFWGQGDGSAVTLGSYINGGRDLKADPNNSLFQHEYGHYLQSQEMGWGYFSRVGIPSLFSADGTGNHKYQPFEQDANRRAFMYFNKNVDGFYTSETEYLQQRNNNSYFNGTSKGWNFYSNPLDVNHIGGGSRGRYYDYNKPEHRALVNGLSLSAKWYNYFDPFGIFFAGWINNSYYKKHRIK